jgi:prevent-host-death family protein
MRTVSVADAKARLSELLDCVEAGEDVMITRRGAAVARVTKAPSARPPLDLSRVRAFRDTLPMQEESSGDLLRRLQDSDRY